MEPEGSLQYSQEPDPSSPYHTILSSLCSFLQPPVTISLRSKYSPQHPILKLYLQIKNKLHGFSPQANYMRLKNIIILIPLHIML
jgi:hypothetical protein